MQSKTETIQLDGFGIRLTTWGDEACQPILFLHGFMDVGASFHSICEQLGHAYYCVAPDLRGFGGSDHTQHPLGYYFFDYLFDLFSLLERFSRRSICLVGHSMGGNIASMFAGSFPERISHLVNIEGFGPRGLPDDDAPDQLRRWLTDQTPHRFRVYPTLEGLAKRLQTKNRALTDLDAQWIASQMSRPISGGIQISADPKHKRPSPMIIPVAQYAAFWRRIRAKTILMIGEQSNFGNWLPAGVDATAELDRRLSNFPADTQRLIVARSGHMVHLDRPDAVVSAIRGLLAGRSIPSPL